MKTWQLNTESFREEERRDVWRDAMRRLCLPIGEIPDSGKFHGNLSYLISPLGIEFALIEGGAQEISGSYLDQPAAIWLVLLLEGEALLTDGNQQIRIKPGDMIYGPTGVEATLSFSSEFRQMHIKAPRLALNPRLIFPLSLELGYIPGEEGIDHVLSGMLYSLADVLEDMTTEQLRPIELAFTELLISSLASERNVFSLGGAAGAREAHLHRICQTIETRLGDPDLNPGRIAEEHGVSQRYLQKLFTVAGKTFTNYVRIRRLERCRADLVSPLYAQLSLSEICFRWGFNGSAHFSRTFRDQYGASPRDYRRQHTSQV